MTDSLVDEFRQWVRSTYRHTRLLGPTGVARSLLILYQDVLVNRVSDRFGRFDGVPVYERDWDLLVVLDGCRVDVLQAVADEYDFLGTVDAVDSVAGHSAGWMAATFDDRYAEQRAATGYVSANPHTEDHLEERDFAVLDEVWRYAWDDDVGTVPPRSVTDRTVALAREGAADRYIAHYMQPHFPSIPRPDVGGALPRGDTGWPDSVWERLKEGDVDNDDVWAAYEANLHHVLEEVELLLSNVDADRVVVTADHGNAMGSYGFYGHGDYIPLASVHRVPWVVTSATDEGTHEPETEPDAEAAPDVTDRLEALGYRE